MLLLLFAALLFPPGCGSRTVSALDATNPPADAPADIPVDAPDAAAPDAAAPDVRTPPPAPLKHRWHKLLKATGHAHTNDIELDSASNIYLTGTFNKTVDLGGGTVAAKGGPDIFVTSFSSAGVHRWQKALGGAGQDYGNGVAVGGGVVNVTGVFQGKVELGGGAVTGKGNYDIFVTSFSSAGVHRWHKALGDTSPDYSRAVAMDGSGNLYLAGDFSGGSADLGGGVVTGSGYSNLFITSFTSAGVHRWHKVLACNHEIYGRSAAVDGKGTIFVAGDHSGMSEVSGGDIKYGSKFIRMFITRFSSAGVPSGHTIMSSTHSIRGQSVAVDSNGHLYFTGTFSGPVDLGSGTVTTKYNDAFVTGLSPSGGHWQKVLAGNSEVDSRSVAVDSAGNVYLAGTFSGTADLGGGKVTAKGSSDLFVTSFTSTGAHRWQMVLGGAGGDEGHAVAVDGAGSVYLAGTVSGTLDLGGGKLASVGTKGGFLVKYTP